MVVLGLFPTVGYTVVFGVLSSSTIGISTAFRMYTGCGLDVVLGVKADSGWGDAALGVPSAILTGVDTTLRLDTAITAGRAVLVLMPLLVPIPGLIAIRLFLPEPFLVEMPVLVSTPPFLLVRVLVLMRPLVSILLLVSVSIPLLVWILVSIPLLLSVSMPFLLSLQIPVSMWIPL